MRRVESIFTVNSDSDLLKLIFKQLILDQVLLLASGCYSFLSLSSFTFPLTAPQSHLAFVDTLVAMPLAPYLIYPDSHLS